jgi:hypothetical protein
MNKKNKFIAFLMICLLPLIAFGADLTVSWPAAPAADQVTHYEVFMGTNGTPGEVGSLVATTTNTTHTFADVTEGNTYSVAVRAVNLAGPGLFSDNVATAGPPGKTGAVTLTVIP